MQRPRDIALDGHGWSASCVGIFVGALVSLVARVGGDLEARDVQLRHFLALVDKEKQIRGTYDGTDKSSVQQLIGDIKVLRKEYE